MHLKIIFQEKRTKILLTHPALHYLYYICTIRSSLEWQYSLLMLHREYVLVFNIKNQSLTID